MGQQSSNRRIGPSAARASSRANRVPTSTRRPRLAQTARAAPRPGSAMMSRGSTVSTARPCTVATSRSREDFGRGPLRPDFLYEASVGAVRDDEFYGDLDRTGDGRLDVVELRDFPVERQLDQVIAKKGGDERDRPATFRRIERESLIDAPEVHR